MFSGKSTELIRRMHRYQIAGRRCVIIKYSKDNRYGSSAHELITHDQQSKATAVSASRLAEVVIVEDIDCVGIDEGQFYPDILEYAERWANAGKIVVISALDSTYQRKPFGSIPELVAVADQVIKLNAVCHQCKSETAAFTKRITDETELEVIGGADKYVAVCRKCM